MSFKDTWRPRIDGVDDADSSAVNEIAEAVINNENFINNAPNKYYNKESVNNLFANALKGSASGEAVALKDVSPIEHNLGVRVSSENLFDIEAEPDAAIASSYSYQGGKLTINADAGAQNDYPRLYYEIYNADLFDTYISVSAKWENVVNVDYAYINVAYVNPQKEETQLVWLSHDGGISSKASEIKIPKYEEGAYIGVMLAAYTPDTSVERTFTVFDVAINRGIEAKPYTPPISDLSAVKLLVQGANLLPPINATVTEGDVTAVFKDGYVTFSGSVPSGGSEHISYYIPESDKRFYSAGIYRMGWIGYQNVDIMAGAYSKDHRWLFNISPRLGATISEEFYIDYFGIVVTEELIGKTFPLMLKLDTDNVLFEAAKEYEPYKEPIEYSQGEEIKSIYPSTTLMTDTAGAVLTVEYNKDANKVVKSLEDRISALEAMIVSQ